MSGMWLEGSRRADQVKLMRLAKMPCNQTPHPLALMDLELKKLPVNRRKIAGTWRVDCKIILFFFCAGVRRHKVTSVIVAALKV